MSRNTWNLPTWALNKEPQVAWTLGSHGICIAVVKRAIIPSLHALAQAGA